ncbi:MAG: hypothetical protein Q9227_000257, partial [Pyrenula ochraceoflavens]
MARASPGGNSSFRISRSGLFFGIMIEPLGFLLPIFGREDIEIRSARLSRSPKPVSDSEPEDDDDDEEEVGDSADPG